MGWLEVGWGAEIMLSGSLGAMGGTKLPSPFLLSVPAEWSGAFPSLREILGHPVGPRASKEAQP